LQEYAVVITARAFVRTPDYWQALYALQKAVQIALRRDGVLLAAPRQAAVIRGEPLSPATAPPEKEAAPARRDATDGPEHGATGPHGTPCQGKRVSNRKGPFPQGQPAPKCPHGTARERSRTKKPLSGQVFNQEIFPARPFSASGCCL
jgi:hypothetical protein